MLQLLLIQLKNHLFFLSSCLVLSRERAKRKVNWDNFTSTSEQLHYKNKNIVAQRNHRQLRQYYGDYHTQSCCGDGTDNTKLDIFKPVLYSFLVPLAVGLGFAILWLLTHSVKLGVIAFLQQQQQQEEQQQQTSNNLNQNTNNQNTDTVSITIMNTLAGG